MIRKATGKDSKGISGLCSIELGYPCEEKLVFGRLANLDADRELVLVAELDNRIVGFIHAEKYEPLYSQCMINILGIAVDNTFQRRGIGRKLIEALENWAQSCGITTIRLNSGILRTDAHVFYRKLGFNDEKEQKRFIKQLGQYFGG